MYQHLQPARYEMITLKRRSLVRVLSGEGPIEVDFRPYRSWRGKILSLYAGQYIRFLEGNFRAQLIELPDSACDAARDARVLFRHLVSVGYVEYDDASRWASTHPGNPGRADPHSIINALVSAWFQQNPFGASTDEYRLLFDVKEVIDASIREHVSVSAILAQVDGPPGRAGRLIKAKLGTTILRMLRRQKLLECQRQLAFTSKRVKSVAFDLGYRDVSYFCRSFRSATGLAPKDFRDAYAFAPRNLFSQAVAALIAEFHHREHRVAFYAGKLHMDPTSFARKVKLCTNETPGRLIRKAVLSSAKERLEQGERVKRVALDLGFRDPNYFSSFFAKHSGEAPSSYRARKMP